MFKIGERVVCIDDTMKPHTIEELNKDMPNWIKKGVKYTVRGFTDNNGIVEGMWLEEVVNKPLFFKLINRFQEPAFALWRFSRSEPAEIQMEVEELKLVA